MISSKIVLFIFLNTFIYNSFGFFGIRKQFWKSTLRKKLKGIQRNVENDFLYVSTKSMNQVLDHFNPDKTRTWNMRYLEDVQYWQAGGPLIVNIGGEGAIDLNYLSFPLITSFAKEVNGAIFVPEHRFYGESIPFNDTSTDNMLYLSSMQALADLKDFIVHLKSGDQYKDAKVVVFGGSYPGNLAAWMRLLHPDVVDAALSSSAPVLAEVDFNEYNQVVGEGIKKFVPDCYDQVVKKFQRYNELLKTAEGVDLLKKENNICDHVDMNSPNNVHLFLETKLEPYEGLVQYGTPDNIKEKCSEIGGFVYNSLILDSNENCLNFDFDEYADTLKRSDYDAVSWTYQTCTEFGYYQTTSLDGFPSSVLPLDFFFNICTALFGQEFDQKRVEDGVAKTNGQYHGLAPNVEKVFFVNGDIDPWHKLGVLEDLSEEAPARVVTDASHCAILFDDTSDLSRLIKQKLKEWIGM